MLSNKEIICPNNLLDEAHKKKGVKVAIVNAGKPLPMLSVQDAVNENLIEPIFIGNEKDIKQCADNLKWDISKYEIIHELLKALNSSINELKTILFQELSVTREAKEKSERISNIAFQLQSCLNLESSDIAKNLCWCYRYIRYMAKRIQDNECMNYVKPASDVANTILQAWETIPESKRY